MSEQALPTLDKDYADASDKDSYLDSHRQIRDWWYQARSTHASNRRDQSIDANFKDGLQWDERDRAVLEERNQKPLTFNEIHPTIEWLCGTERRARTDWSILPRSGDEEANKDAKLKTDIFKFISDDTHYPWERSQAFRDAVTVGVGWLEVGVRGDPSDQPIFVRRDSWRNNWTDPLSVSQIGDDARYHFRSKIIDLDIAIKMWPNHEDAPRGRTSGPLAVRVRRRIHRHAALLRPERADAKPSRGCPVLESEPAHRGPSRRGVV